jgi:hypothetical protein
VSMLLLVAGVVGGGFAFGVGLLFDRFVGIA